ncbi:transmembrane protein, putative [Bodo saltans]|uniref:Transmembrane protein, putative n=1 Tax=Bodo saltans TaxID=75058 RepID=A0A0S4JSI4_BODSA|nr:transmembrane protein, putative [Bodo saltans]|eukprot:CUG93185.1 transmembrane protein, putative [Bodo saltans]
MSSVEERAGLGSGAAEVSVIIPRHAIHDDDDDDLKPSSRSATLPSSGASSTPSIWVRVVEGTAFLWKQSVWFIMNTLSVSISLGVSLVVLGLIVFTLYEMLRGGGSS